MNEIRRVLTEYVKRDECVNTPDAPDFKPGKHTDCLYCQGVAALAEPAEIINENAEAELKEIEKAGDKIAVAIVALRKASGDRYASVMDGGRSAEYRYTVAMETVYNASLDLFKLLDC